MSPGFYRGEAQRTRRLAAEQADQHDVQKLLRLAAEYEDLADDMELPRQAMVEHQAP